MCLGLLADSSVGPAICITCRQLLTIAQACEPVHAQVCPITSSIVLVNACHDEFRGLLDVLMTGLEGQDYGSMVSCMHTWWK